MLCLKYLLIFRNWEVKLIFLLFSFILQSNYFKEYLQNTSEK